MKYSIIINVYNLEYLKCTIDSILRQKYDLSKVELIIEDSSDEEVRNYLATIDINYIYHRCDNVCDKYNNGLSVAKGEYIAFIDNGIIYPKKYFKKCDKLLKRYNILGCNIKYYNPSLEINKKYKMLPKKSGYYSVVENYDSLDLCLDSYIFKKDIIKSSFANNIYDECKILFILDEVKEYYYEDNIILESLEAFEDSKFNNLQYEKWWYIDSLKNFIIPLLERNQHMYIQEAVMYLICAKYKYNSGFNNKALLSGDEVEEFINYTVKALEYIDDKLIIQDQYYEEDSIKHNYSLSGWLKYYLLNKKVSNLKLKRQIIYKDDHFIYKYGKNIINIGGNEIRSINICCINYKNNKLYFDCSSNLGNIFNSDKIKIVVKSGKNKSVVKRSYFYPDNTIFDKKISEKYNFKFVVPVEFGSKIELYLVVDKKEIPLMFKYSGVGARLTNSKRSYWAYNNFILKNKVNYIKIDKYSIVNNIFSEIVFALSKLKNVRNKIRVCKLLFLRLIYFITRPYYKSKHIWLTFDKLYKAGDNGEYIYHYALEHGKNIYYIINGDAKEYDMLKKDNSKHIIKFNSLKCKLYTLHAEVILKTHAGYMGFCGFSGISKDFAAGIMNAEIIEIQHGLTIQNIPQYQNRVLDNIKLYLLASKYEYNNLMNDYYDYSENQLKITGLARYDGLKDKHKKVILITPTWRHSIASQSTKFGTVRGYNNIFKDSDYFKVYDSLINNKILIKCAREYGYRIVYLIHPTLTSQIEDFNKNEFVDIIPAVGDVSYEKILTESSLMITDYSGVQYDFAYMKKPILYYHPDKLPPHYNTGSMDFEKMGFGKICKSEDLLVDEICNYMKNDCKNKNEYVRRCNDFFAYSDYDNCKRIIKEIDEYLLERE